MKEIVSAPAWAVGLASAMAMASATVLLAGCTRIPERDAGAASADATACSCEGRRCGDDGCGGSCGSCEGGASCVAGACVGCTASCIGRVCGADGCGGVCGTCASPDVCASGQCRCTPSCGERGCGDDGCGGSCGTCGADQLCSAGGCVCREPLTCYRDADGDGYVGDSVESCGTCPAGYAPLGPEEALDCLDDPSNADSAGVHPEAFFSEDAYCDGSGAACASGTASDSFDWDCDGAITPRFGVYTPSSSGLCGCSSHGISSPHGYLAEPPPCGVPAAWTSCCTGVADVRQQCR